MKTKILHKVLPTNDLIIRSALKEDLRRRYARNKKLRIIEELGVQHGTARIDIAVVNGTMHGYEIKSDQDTLKRLPEQMDIFNSVFDKMTLIVGKNHLYEAINIVPDWGGNCYGLHRHQPLLLLAIFAPKTLRLFRALWTRYGRNSCACFNKNHAV